MAKRKRSSSRGYGERGASVYCVDTHAGKRCVRQSAHTNDVRFIKANNSRCPAACYKKAVPKRHGKQRPSDW
jgi:hypothetical protein